MQGKYKVYIIDEVHMMTPSAFNALLKTLEEPPEYCVFILATTEPHKVLPTIVSRCQRFDFNKVPVPVMKERLRYIVDKEGIKCDDSALQLISELAEGGMRDALSVLDQCIAYAENNITAEDVSVVYGIATTAEKLELLKAVKDKDVQKTMSMVSDFSGRGIDLQRLTLDLINLAKEAVIYSYSKNKDLLEKATVDQVRELLNEYSSGELLKCIDYLMDTSGKYKDSSDSMSYLEVCLLKMMNVAGTMPQPEPIVRVVAETQPVKEEKAEIEVQEEPEEVPVQIETPVVEEKKPVIRAIKNLSDENFYDILTKATKAIKEADYSNWQNVVNCREGKFMAVTSMLNGSKIMADSPKDIIVTVEERVVADNINELNNLALLEELVEKEFGVHKNVVAVTREQTEYLINYFRSRKSQPVQPVIKQEETVVEEKPSTVDNLAKIFGQNGFDIVED